MIREDRKRWFIATLLFLATLLNYFDRQIFSLVSPVLRQQLSLTATEYARLLDAFLLGYTSMQFIAGWIIDRLGARRGLMLAMLWWSAAGACVAITHTSTQLAVCLFLMGAGEAANWPAAVRAIRDWFPPSGRALAVGFFNAGSSAGAVLAPFIVTRLTLHFSWRAAFLLCGGLGVLWIVPWRLACSARQAEEEPPSGAALHSLAFFRDRRAWAIILARFFADSIWFFYIFWLPDYLSHVLHLSLQAIGSIAWIPFLAAGIGNFAGGSASGFLIRKRRAAVPARLTVMGFSALAMAGGAAIRYCHTAGLAISVISVVVFAYSAWAANVLTLPGDIFPAWEVATVTGAAGTIAGAGGMLTTWLAGWTIDHYSYGPVFIGLACLPAVAFACSLMAGGRAEAKSIPLSPQIT